MCEADTILVKSTDSLTYETLLDPQSSPSQTEPLETIRHYCLFCVCDGTEVAYLIYHSSVGKQLSPLRGSKH